MPKVVVELGPTGVEIVGIKSGTLTGPRARRSIGFDRGANTDGAMMLLEKPLRDCVGELGLRGATACVIYHSSHGAASLVSCPKAVGLRNAEPAALLALSTAADISSESLCLASTPLHEDGPYGMDGSDGSQIHVLAAAEEEDNIGLIFGMCSRAGLEVDRVIPAQAAALAQATGVALGASSGGPIAVLWLGRDSSALAAAEADVLAFARGISTGLASFALALTREIRPRRSPSEPPAEPVMLSDAQAWEVFQRVGIPTRDHPIDNHPGLTTSAIMPLLQPALQRLSVEVKQSLRFGLPERARGRVRLLVTGPGADIPGLPESIADHVGCALFHASSHPDAQSAPVIDPSRIPSEFNFLPRRIRDVRTARKRRTAILVGTALAMAAIAGEYLWTRRLVGEQSVLLTTLSHNRSLIDEAIRTREEVLTRRAHVESLRQNIRAQAGDKPSASALLALLSSATPPAAALRTVELDSNPAHVSLEGYVPFQTDVDPPQVIQDFIRSLSEAPIVASARLSGSSRAVTALGDCQIFSIELTLVPLPPVVPDTGQSLVNQEVTSP